MADKKYAKEFHFARFMASGTGIWDYIGKLLAIGITGLGSLGPNIERAGKYAKNLKPTMYIVSLRERKYHKFDKLI